jgi:ATP-dependent Clp protease ATP-binding subunit ClpC
MPMRHLDAHGRAVVNLANEIARDEGLDYVGTEHVLLGILRHDEGIGSRVLRRLGVTEERARQVIAQIVQRDKEDTWVFGRLPGTPNYRRVIELAIEEAARLNARQIGSEHLLLALLREKDTTAGRALAALGVAATKCRQEILRELAPPSG